MKLIAGSANPQLSKNLAKKLKIPLVDREISKFSNGELRVWIKDDLHGEDVCLVQSFSDPVDTELMETLLMADALERMGVEELVAVIPWMGYSLQDKIFRHGEPISAKLVASLISHSFIKQVVLMDLHNDSIQGFYSIPTDYLSAIPVFKKYIKDNYDLKNTVIGSPDFGGLKRARKFAATMDLDLINIDKGRDLKTGEVTTFGIHGEVKGKNVIFYDDVINSGGTVVKTAEIVKKHGAKKVAFLSTHGIFCKNAIARIGKSKVDEVVVTNSIEHNNLNHKFKILDVSPVFAKALKRWVD